MKIKILESATQDLLHGYRFYEQQEQGLGAYFLDSLFSDIDSLQIFAGIHRSYFGKNRLLAKRFPYAVYYSIQHDIVLVHAVLDCRRDPNKISKKLKN
jgi:plasmid stabilization system protein ParE